MKLNDVYTRRDDLYEVTVSFTYKADGPVDAVQQFMDNLHYANWYVEAVNLSTGKQYTVDTEDWDYTER